MSVALTDDATQSGLASGYTATRLVGLDDPFVNLAGRWSTSPFHTSAFLHTLMETIGAARQAELILVAVHDAAGAPCALFPFTLVREGNLRVIEGLGLGVADYYVPLSAPGPAPSAAEARALWRAVRAALPAADVLRLRNVPRLALGRPHALSNAAFLAPAGHGATTVVARDLAGDPVYDIKALPLNRPLRKWVRRLEAEFGKMSFTAAETEAEIAELVDTMVSYRLDRFADLGRADFMADPAVVDFYRSLALPKTGPALARVYGLRAGDEIVGVIYGLPQGDTYTAVISSMSSDPKYNRVSPGVMAMYFAIDDCVKRGHRIYDLSIGELSYKSRFGGELVELCERRDALSLLGLPSVLIGRARSFARVYLRRHPGLAAKLRRSRPAAPAPAED